MNFSSKLLENAVNEVSQLPGIGKRTALRLVLHLLKQSKTHTKHLTTALDALVEQVKLCKSCYSISDVEVCEICSSSQRNKEIICVVEDIRDVMAIENTVQFKGLYHVLGGRISPMEGVGPHNLTISELIERIESGVVKEVVLALSSTMEGDTTNFYIYKQLQKYQITISTIARGISVGDELQYTDEVTLGRSIANRVPFGDSLAQ
ncbi:recombination mediator RecR [Flavicella marina]|uniref:recombination mediator RecR n=1 Tax=Flavicella marina TaxID=1475951 RepID=UPI001264CB4C|nr:recombination mediator RecR [Flavicella marina]